jgi:hypothetical protein
MRSASTSRACRRAGSTRHHGRDIFRPVRICRHTFRRGLWCRKRRSLRVRRDATGRRVQSNCGWQTFRADHRFPWRSRHNGAPQQRRPDDRAVRHSGEYDDEGASRTRTSRPYLYTQRPNPTGAGAGDLRTLVHSCCRPRLVGRQSGRLLHRCASARTQQGKCCVSSSSIRSEASRNSRCAHRSYDYPTSDRQSLHRSCA